jgi:very-short-patch-repair endonuclease
MIQIRKFYDIIPDEGTPTSQTHKDMSAEEILDKHEWLKGGGWTKDGILKAMQEYASQFQPLPVGGKSVEEIEKLAERYADEFYDKNDSEDSVKWENRKHNFIAGYKACQQQPVSDALVDHQKQTAEYVLDNGFEQKVYQAEQQKQREVYIPDGDIKGLYIPTYLKKATTPIVQGYSEDTLRAAISAGLSIGYSPNYKLENREQEIQNILSSLPQSTSITK